MSSAVPLPAPGGVSAANGVAPMLAAWAALFLAACLAWEQSLDDQIETLRAQMAAMGEPPQMPEQPEPREITDTPWSHGNGGSIYSPGNGLGVYTTDPTSYTRGNPGASVYDAFRRRADAAAESLRLWIEANERRRRAGLPPLPWIGTGGFG